MESRVISSNSVMKGWRSGQADVAVALAEVGGVADEESHAGAVEAGDSGEVEHNAMELTDDTVEDGFEELELFAVNDAAGALEDEDVATKAFFNLEGHYGPC